VPVLVVLVVLPGVVGVVPVVPGVVGVVPVVPGVVPVVPGVVSGGTVVVVPVVPSVGGVVSVDGGVVGVVPVVPVVVVCVCVVTGAGAVCVTAGASGVSEIETISPPRLPSWLAEIGTPGVPSMSSVTTLPPTSVTTTRRLSAVAGVELNPPMMSAVPAASEAMRSFVLFIGPTSSSRTTAGAASSLDRRDGDRTGSYLLFWTFAKENPRVCIALPTDERSSTEASARCSRPLSTTGKLAQG
jgi:hypothetical protein